MSRAAPASIISHHFTENNQVPQPLVKPARLFAAILSTAALALAAGSAHAEGQAIYTQYCASCHGQDLKGNQAQSLIDGVWQFGDGNNIFRNIKFGISSAGMPDYQAGLSDGQIREVIDYINTMAKEAGAPDRPPLPEQLYTRDYDVKVEEWITEGISIPWAMIFIDDNTALLTERPGGLRLIKDGKLHPEPIANTPEVFHRGQGGLMDVAIDPDYKQNGWVYLSYSYENPRAEGQAMTRIVRGKIVDHRWVDQEVLWELDPGDRDLWSGSGVHYGSRIAFDKDGYLFFSHGERGNQNLAQQLNRPHGKIHRINRDGSIPADNPFADVPGAMPSIWSYGHRNPQGLAFHPETGLLWETEHGPMGGDEINVVRPGLNYGWPVITYGLNYNGTPITDKLRQDDMVQPTAYYIPSIAVCGIDFVTGDQFPRWQNNLLVTGLGMQELRRVVVEDDRVLHQEMLLKNAGRVRDVCVGPDGAIYAILNGPDQIIKLTSLGPALRQ